MTTLISANGTKDGLYYNYRLDVEGDKITEPQKLKVTDTLRNNIVKQVCGTEAMREGINEGDAYIYNYSDISGKAIATITVKKPDCTPTNL